MPPSRVHHRTLTVLAFAIALGLALTATATAAASTFGSRTLRKGMRGADVKILQQDLSTAGWATYADDAFGSQTRRGVQRFERSAGMRADGVVDATEARRIQAAVVTAEQALHPVSGSRARLTRSGLARPPRRAPQLVYAFIAAANRIAHKGYRVGGGHGRWNDSAYDCSGSVSYALHGASLLGFPLDSGHLARWGRRRRGHWMTIYANAGHVYTVVAGLRFDTTARFIKGSRWTAEQRSSSGFAVRHPAGL